MLNLETAQERVAGLCYEKEAVRLVLTVQAETLGALLMECWTGEGEIRDIVEDDFDATRAELAKLEAHA